MKGFARIAAALVLLAGCSGYSGVPPLTAGPFAAAPHPLVVSGSDFKRIAVWGSKGSTAVAQCPQGYKIVAGGSSSSDGSTVGTGYANFSLNSWVVKPDSSATAEAFATCVSRAARAAFRWRSAGPVSGIAAAQCPPDFVLVTGFGQGTIKTSYFNASGNSYWVKGGGNAYASCARKSAGVVIRHAWNKSQKPKTVYAGCGDGYTVIGGAMGNNAWPGPPIQEHPGVSGGPGMHGYNGWWTFSNALNELTWAACVLQ